MFFSIQGYFSGTSQYQFIAETYFIIVLCILFARGLMDVHDCFLFMHNCFLDDIDRWCNGRRHAAAE